MSSQIGQDQWVLSVLKNKRNGYFIDIGCYYPDELSNTDILESEYGWRGLAIDIQNFGDWSYRKNTIHILKNALEIDYYDLFKHLNVPTVVDYLSIDLEPPQLTLDCLYKIPFDIYKFKTITFETDEYREGGEERKSLSRKFLQEKGYTFVKNVAKQDDFYILSE